MFSASQFCKALAQCFYLRDMRALFQSQGLSADAGMRALFRGESFDYAHAAALATMSTGA